VAREKAALLAALSPEDGVAIVNADQPLLRPHLRRVKTKILFGETADADLRLTARGKEGDHWYFEVNSRARFSLALPGRHNAVNALAAVAVARRMGLDDEQIRRFARAC
jgi:UDP-N-acetylmuramyl pentapeptide synthase